jgi:hypothetical protein
MGLAAAAYDPVYLEWNILFLGIYSLPLIMFTIPFRLHRWTAGWCAVFLILQALFGLLFDPDFKTLPPNMNERGVITTDQMGFRVVPPIDYDNKNGIRILAISGSTTEELHAHDTITWPYLLQTLRMLK